MPRLQAPQPLSTSTADAANAGENKNYNQTDICDAESIITRQPSMTEISEQLSEPKQTEDKIYLLTNLGNPEEEMQTVSQQVHILSSGGEEVFDADDDVISVLSSSKCSSDFAGFTSSETPKNTPSKENTVSIINNAHSDEVELKKEDVGSVNKVEIAPIEKCNHTSAEEAHEPKKRSSYPTNALQIVEIKSNSMLTTPQDHPFLQRLQTLQMAHQSETSSEFPVSSPSNPILRTGRAGKYFKRASLLKNTLPADAFERNLAQITASKPQMSLADKIKTWPCDAELSDVEDVNNFDLLFKQFEEQKKKLLARAKKCSNSTNKKNKSNSMAHPHSLQQDSSIINLEGLKPETKYDFAQFRQHVRNLKVPAMRQKSKTKTTEDLEKASTSALALQRHRQHKAHAYSIVNTNASTYNSVPAVPELKKRTNPKNTKVKVCQDDSSNSSSSSNKDKRNYMIGENSANIDGGDEGTEEEKCIVSEEQTFKRTHWNPMKKRLLKNRRPQDSEENYLSLDNTSTDNSLEEEKINQSHQLSTQSATLMANKNKRQLKSSIKTPGSVSVAGTALVTASVAEMYPTPGLHNGALFRRCEHVEPDPVGSQQQQGLIQMRLDFLQDLQLKTRAKELFKTPTVPQKYLLLSPPTPSPPPPSPPPPPPPSLPARAPLQSVPQLSSPPAAMFKHGTTTSEQERLQLKAKEDVSYAAKDTICVSDPAKTSIAPNIDSCSSFHQQHEFCNYLGLTGMSTANAVALAAAELAKCHINRRSLRVQRQQHQQEKQQEKHTKSDNMTNDKHKEKEKEKVAKKEDREFDLQQQHQPHQSYQLKNREQKELEALKMKQLNELQRHENTSNQSSTEPTDEDKISFKSRIIDVKTPPKIEAEPEIKILCQISSSSKEDAEKVTRSCAKRLVAPMRDSLLQHFKQKYTTADRNLIKQENQSNGNKKKLENENVKNRKRTRLRSAYSTKSRSNTPTECSGRGGVHEVCVKNETLNHRRSTSRSRCSEKNIKTKMPKEEVPEDSQGRMRDLHNKFQKCLETARKTKPSIYIVKSFASGINSPNETNKSHPRPHGYQHAPATETSTTKCIATSTQAKKKLNNTIINNKKAAPGVTTTTSSKSTILVGCSTTTLVGRRHKSSHSIMQGQALRNRVKKKSKIQIQKLLTRSTSNMRQLRSRKIYVVKAKKHCSKTKFKTKSTKVDKATLTCDMNGWQNGNKKRTSPVDNSPIGDSMQRIAKTNEIAQELLDATRAALVTVAAVDDTPNSLTTVPGITKSAATNTPIKNKLGRNNRGDSPLQNILNKTINYFSYSNNADDKGTTQQSQETTNNLLPTKNPLPTTQISDNDSVVVSSTTNTFDETMLNSSHGNSNSIMPPNTNNEVSAGNNNYADVPFTNNIQQAQVQQQQQQQPHPPHAYAATRDNAAQSTLRAFGGSDVEASGKRGSVGSGGSIHYLAAAPVKKLRNPLDLKNGEVLYIFYELDVLIVVQEFLISFWKFSKLINVLAIASSNNNHQQQGTGNSSRVSVSQSSGSGEAGSGTSACKTSVEGGLVDISGEWLQMSECRRLINDTEIKTPYANRICMHNSIPIYVEMRTRELTHERRDCNLLSMYINVYYYHEDEMVAKTHSIQLDAVQCLPNRVIYTTIPESRYFIMSWPQENILGKVRSGICKYSLTPQLDTLASIREFKSMRHELLYLECTIDDKLLGFGVTQLTIWDHRSGDVLMNYDLELPLGRNLGSIYYPSLEIGQNNMILLFQYIQQSNCMNASHTPELLVIACSISHTTPSHRVLQRQQLPQPAFSAIKTAINTGDHLLITAQSDEEIWISCSDPNMITCVVAQHTQRFYARGRTQLIELTPDTLTVDSFANYVLKLAAADSAYGLVKSQSAQSAVEQSSSLSKNL